MIDPKTLAAWREDAEDNIHDLCDHEPQCDDRIIVLLDKLAAVPKHAAIPACAECECETFTCGGCGALYE